MSKKKRKPRRIEFMGGPADGDVRTFGEEPPIVYRIPSEPARVTRGRGGDDDEDERVARYLFDVESGSYVWERMMKR